MIASKYQNQASFERAIHVIDDEEHVVNLVTSALQREGYPVHSFSSASKALEDIEMHCKKRVGMLISDARMPDHSGFEVARRTRAVNPDVPIILMTPFEINPAEFDVIFPSLHINAFIRKPFRVSKLLTLVRRYTIHIV